MKYYQSEEKLLNIIPPDQLNKVLNDPECEIEPGFLGFIHIYDHLSEIIPLHFTIVDLGCAYNPQCFFFKEHKRYLAVDQSNCLKFQSPNCTIFEMTIENFIKNELQNLNLEETFAICSYVPPWGNDNIKLVREAFKNIFTYYPHGGEIPTIRV